MRSFLRLEPILASSSSTSWFGHARRGLEKSLNFIKIKFSLSSSSSSLLPCPDRFCLPLPAIFSHDREQNITFLRRRRQLHFRLYFARILFYEASNLRLFMPSRSLISYKWQLDIVVVIIVVRKVVRDHHLSCRHFVRNNRFEADVAFWRNSFVRHFFII